MVKITEVLAYNTSVKEGDNLGLILFIMKMPFMSDIFPLKILVKNAMERQKVLTYGHISYTFRRRYKVRCLFYEIATVVVLFRIGRPRLKSKAQLVYLAKS